MSDRHCQWCGELAKADDTNCYACGAALPLAGPVDELRIPGVTDVDPELKLSAKLPRRVIVGSPTQGMAAGAIGASALGGIGGVVALGALAAVAANEYKGASQGREGGGSALDVGQPSEAALEMARKLREEEKKASDETAGD